MKPSQTSSTTNGVFYSTQVTKENRLFKAIATKNIDTVKQLADNVTCNAINNQELSPLDMLIEQSEHITADEARILVEIGVVLIAAGANVHHQHARSKKTALHVAAEYGCIPLCALLISSGSDIEARDSIGATPIMSAALFERTGATVNYLAQQQANVHAKTYSETKGIVGGEMTALHFAFDEGQINNILALFENSASLDAVSNCGGTVLECMNMNLYKVFDLAPQLSRSFADILACKKILYAARINSNSNKDNSRTILDYENKLESLLTKHDSEISNAKSNVQGKLSIMVQEKNKSRDQYIYK